jgi:hypothetical protein
MFFQPWSAVGHTITDQRMLFVSFGRAGSMLKSSSDPKNLEVEMRKIFLLIIPFTVIIVLGITFFMIGFDRPVEWQDDLNRYLQYKNANASWEYEVLFTVEAGSPWNVNTEMSSLSFGESMHYQTDLGYGDDSSDPDTPSTVLEAPRNGHLMALPFPPEEVWCVLLGREDNLEPHQLTDEAVELILVALHQDLYNADYIIHEIAGGSDAKRFSEVVRAIDCEMNFD